MTDDIKAIRERLEAATPGPWRLQGEYVCADDGEVDVAETFNLRDRALIAHARTDLAALCDEVEVWREVGAALGVDGPAAALAEALRLRAATKRSDNVHHISDLGAGASCGDPAPCRATTSPASVTCDRCLRVLAVRWELGLRLRDDGEAPRG